MYTHNHIISIVVVVIIDIIITSSIVNNVIIVVINIIVIYVWNTRSFSEAVFLSVINLINSLFIYFIALVFPEKSV